MPDNPAPERLTPENLALGLDFLRSADPDLGSLQDRYGPPPVWARAPGFPTLVHIILEQQVSLASARAAFQKLQAACETLTPTAFLELDAPELKRIGFSRQKAAYCRSLACAIIDRQIDLDTLANLDDAAVHTRLTKLKGIGPWTADIYLLMVLLRPDSWPGGDLALAQALQELKGLPTRPKPDELEDLALPWRPWRAVAARLLWHFYLIKRGQL